MSCNITVKEVCKGAGEKLDFVVDWTAWLGSDTIAASVWSEASGIVQEVSPAPSFTNTVATAWYSGGTAGNTYRITNTITTAAGRVAERSMDVEIV